MLLVATEPRPIEAGVRCGSRCCVLLRCQRQVSNDMSVTVSVQLSAGRFPVALEPTDTIKVLKTKLRTSNPAITHVNLKAYRLNQGGAYLSDESKTVKDLGLKDGEILHAVKRVACPLAAVDTEKPTADE